MNKHPAQTPPRTVPWESPALLPRFEMHQDKPSGATVWITCPTKYGMSQGVGHIMELRGRAVHGFKELTMAYLGEEPIAGKGEA